jgi:hypothetical protein
MTLRNSDSLPSTQPPFDRSEVVQHLFESRPQFPAPGDLFVDFSDRLGPCRSNVIEANVCAFPVSKRTELFAPPVLVREVSFRKIGNLLFVERFTSWSRWCASSTMSMPPFHTLPNIHRNSRAEFGKAWPRVSENMAAVVSMKEHGGEQRGRWKTQFISSRERTSPRRASNSRSKG